MVSSFVGFECFVFLTVSSLFDLSASMNHFVLGEQISRSNLLARSLYLDYFFITQSSMLILLTSILGFVVLILKKGEEHQRDQSHLKSNQSSDSKVVRGSNAKNGN
jgi:NADH:ubiquinone oxidoreductase subunit 6 (subunit J)